MYDSCNSDSLRRHIVSSTQHYPFVALILSALVPGLGQLYNGQQIKGIGFILVYVSSMVIRISLIPQFLEIAHVLNFVTMALFVPVYVLATGDAYRTARRQTQAST